MKSRTGGKVSKPRQVAANTRRKHLSKVLAKARDAEFARVRALRKEEADDAVEMPGDRMDEAHSLEELEVVVGLIERCEEKLKAIDAAFSRLERGRYGICEKCKQEIPIERLKAMPFAAYCIDCQKKRNERKRPGEGDIDEPSRNVWTPPEEMNEAADE
jgi:RNA polymerase-binding transcription factor